MYDYFNGHVAALSPTAVTIDCAGVGFFLHISLHTYSRIKDQQKVKLYAHHVVREDAQLLFGFAEEEERHMFRELLAVSGVGATTARVVLSSMTAGQLRNVIASGDANSLQKVKGIGAKTAQRIVVELQDKMRKGVPLAGAAGIPADMHNNASEEALSALLTLGFARASAEKALSHASKSVGSGAGVEELIKTALAYL